MKHTMKKCLTLLLALALLFTMAVPAAAAPATYNKEITFTNVAQGDTVKAYKLVGYDENYNKYIFHDGFKDFLKIQEPNKLPENVLKDTTKEGLTSMMVSYVMMNGHSLGDSPIITLPSNPVEKVADADNKVQMTLEPGYYLLLVSSTATNTSSVSSASNPATHSVSNPKSKRHSPQQRLSGKRSTPDRSEEKVKHTVAKRVI